MHATKRNESKHWDNIKAIVEGWTICSLKGPQGYKHIVVSVSGYAVHSVNRILLPDSAIIALRKLRWIRANLRQKKRKKLY